jgi:CheY-like chemotaxis protein
MDRKNILIVDDEKDVLKVLEKELTGRGYFIITADNGEDAIMLARSKQPGLIILDVLMPGMDGPEVAIKLKENPKTKDIPIMFLSCLYPKEEEVEKGHMVGVQVMFAKPYDPDELVSMIEELL